MLLTQGRTCNALLVRADATICEYTADTGILGTGLASEDWG